MSSKALRRMGHLADGWFPLVQPGPELDKARATITAAAVEAGRDPEAIGMEGRVDWRGDVDDVERRVDGWREVGATHLSINTMGVGLATVEEHLAALEKVAHALHLN